MGDQKNEAGSPSHATRGTVIGAFGVTEADPGTTGVDRGKPSEVIHQAIRDACSRRFGVVDSQFLCQSVSSVQTRSALVFKSDTSVAEVLVGLRSSKRGSVLLVDTLGKLEGIFTERDFVQRLGDCYAAQASAQISRFMTKDPAVILPEHTIAYALNLMSQGGFRHLPLVDQHSVPVGVLSVKDVVDHIVDSLTRDLLGFEPANSL